MTIALKTTLTALRDALGTSAALTAWAQAAYGRAHKVYVNMDAQAPPGEADCPYVLLYPASAIYGRGAVEKRIALVMECWLFDPDARTLTGTNIVEYEGVQNVLEMLDLAVAAVAAVGTGNALLQEIAAEFETIEAFPFFVAAAPVVYVEPLTLGANRTAL